MTVHPILPPVLLAILALTLAGVLLGAWFRRPTKRWRLAGLTLAVVLLLLAALRAEVGENTRTLPAGAADAEPTVFLVVDRSPAMGVTDFDGRDRMSAVREDVAAVLDAYPRARFAVIAFAAAPTLEWPLSQDTWTLRPVMAAMTPLAATEENLTQTNVAAASNLLRYQLISAHQQFPRARNLVFYFGSGAAGTASPPREFMLADGSVDGGAVFGYGTPDGGPIPATPLSSPVDEAALRAVADQIGVPYVPRTGPADGDMGGASGATGRVDVLDGAEVPETSAPPPTATAQVTETYWLPALLAALLLALEGFLVLRDLRRARPTLPKAGT